VVVGVPVANSTVWVLDLSSGTLTRLDAEPGSVSPEWTPDGRRVLWTRTGDAPGVWWQPWDRSAPAELLLAGGQGTEIVNGGTELFAGIARPGGTMEQRFVPFPVDTTRWSAPIKLRRAPGFNMARISPDGRWIAFVDAQSGVGEVFVYARDGGGRFQVSIGGGAEPHWSADGRELFYRTEGALMSARLFLGTEARVVQRDSLFPMRFPGGTVQPNYTVTPDGSQIILPRPVVISEQPTVVLGWTAELRERLRAVVRTP
jgi:hypothetical protein